MLYNVQQLCTAETLVASVYTIVTRKKTIRLAEWLNIQQPLNVAQKSCDILTAARPLTLYGKKDDRRY